jgi:N-acetylmuramoyl-L-alanine amidase
VAFPIPAHWVAKHSPNQAPRTARVTAIVLHADASPSVEGSLDWMQRPESKVSYHVIVGRNGQVFWLVSPDRTAWHAGVSELDGVKLVNRFSVGVCLSNKNDGKETYPASQRMSAAEVCALLCEYYDIPVERITTHALVSPGRKTDPLGLDLATFRETVKTRIRHAR